MKNFKKMHVAKSCEDAKKWIHSYSDIECQERFGLCRCFMYHLTSPHYSGNDISTYENELLPYESYIHQEVKWVIAGIFKDTNVNKGYYVYKRDA